MFREKIQKSTAARNVSSTRNEMMIVEKVVWYFISSYVIIWEKSYLKNRKNIFWWARKTFMSDILPSFICFEGLDGSGKSTQAHLLACELEKRGNSVFLTAEPTDGAIGRLIRQVLRHEVRTTDQALALLYAADRNHHLYNDEDGIIRNINDGRIVISDRYFYSSVAYQGNTVDGQYVRMINTYPHPEYVIYIDTPVDVCMSRIDRRGEKKELFDRTEFLRKVKASFDSIFSSLPSAVRFLHVDGRTSIEEQKEKIISFVSL